MRYYSTSNKNQTISFKEAVLKGLAPDRGLYMPENIPQLGEDFFATLPGKSLAETAMEVASCFIAPGEVPPAILEKIMVESLNFPIPLVEVGEGAYALELFHGPTLAFKDVGARVMARLIAWFNRDENREVNVLVATSGDTGSAVASGFYGLEGIRVILLYPSGKVSKIQEQQLTTLGSNIHALEVEGTFDDCQHLVKEAFLDKQLNDNLLLTSANSINIARLLPQSFYYFHAWAKYPDDQSKVSVAVPSGNFGNLTAGLIAQKMGLPIDVFIAATNKNDIVPEYLRSGAFRARPSIQTIANAMDVGNPSNFARMLDLFQQDHKTLSNHVQGYSYEDEAIIATMQRVYKKYGYVLDPHGATGYQALMESKGDNRERGIFLETAHPAKFRDVVENALGIKIDLPPALQDCMNKTKEADKISASFDHFKSLLLAL